METRTIDDLPALPLRPTGADPAAERAPYKNNDWVISISPDTENENKETPSATELPRIPRDPALGLSLPDVASSTRHIMLSVTKEGGGAHRERKEDEHVITIQPDKEDEKNKALSEQEKQNCLTWGFAKVTEGFNYVFSFYPELSWKKRFVMTCFSIADAVGAEIAFSTMVKMLATLCSSGGTVGVEIAAQLVGGLAAVVAASLTQRTIGSSFRNASNFKERMDGLSELMDELGQTVSLHLAAAQRLFKRAEKESQSMKDTKEAAERVMSGLPVLIWEITEKFKQSQTGGQSTQVVLPASPVVRSSPVPAKSRVVMPPPPIDLSSSLLVPPNTPVSSPQPR